MSAYTIVGDPHVTHKSLDKASLLFDILEDIGNPVVILGDLFDTKEIVRGKCLNFVLKRLSQSNLQFYILVGNHDWFNLECKEHSLEALKQLRNVTIVDKPFHMNMDSRAVLMLPYYDDLDALKAELKQAREDGVDFIFMHQGVVGFDYGNGYVADGNGHGEIKPEVLKGFTRIISGHFHKFAEEGNLTFLGTPFSHTFGESDQAKYIGILEPHENTLEFLETPFPRHRTIEFDCSQKAPQAKLQHLLEGDDLFRVKLIGTGMQIKAIDQSQFPGVKFIEEQTDGEQVESAAISDTDSNEQKFLNWAKDIKGLDENTISLGLEIMGEAV